AEALWWSMETITTVGYGDLTPVTSTGRVIAVLLMIGGISLVGDPLHDPRGQCRGDRADEDTAGRVVTTAHIDRLLEEIHQLRSEVQRLGDASPAGDGP
ncbi:potassium channel family protein, partial [Mycolicibacterium austroafricanum]|uniref:potassium channel family protein n=1 Tax=Mycolicibacterium austroafricanum TaxID=39687 RepID=UPI000D49A53D